MTEEYINDLFKKYRMSVISKTNLSAEEYQALMQIYDKQIRETRASNRRVI